MHASQPVTELAIRKRLLLLEAEVRRSQIAATWSGLEARVATTSGMLRSAPWWAMGTGAISAFFLARKSQGLARWIPAGLIAWRLFKRWRAG